MLSIGLTVALLLAAPPRPAEETRQVRGRTLVSSLYPRLRLTVAPGFTYEGRVPFDLGEFSGERFVFVDADSTKALKRLVVVQLEQVDPGSTEIYRYDLTKGREMAGLRFVSNAFAFPAARQAVDAPGNEADHTNNLLLSHGFTMPAVWLAARHLTVADGDLRKHEMIVFYMEARSDLTMADLYRGEEPTPTWAAEKAALVERSRAAFSIEPLEARLRPGR